MKFQSSRVETYHSSLRCLKKAVWACIRYAFCAMWPTLMTRSHFPLSSNCTVIFFRKGYKRLIFFFKTFSKSFISYHNSSFHFPPNLFSSFLLSIPVILKGDHVKFSFHLKPFFFSISTLSQFINLNRKKIFPYPLSHLAVSSIIGVRLKFLENPTGKTSLLLSLLVVNAFSGCWRY